MIPKFFRLQSGEDYQRLVDGLVHESINPNEQGGYVCGYKMIDGPDGVYHIFGLDGVTVIAQEQGSLIEMWVRDTKQAQATKGLLSQLTGVSANKFFMMR